MNIPANSPYFTIRLDGSNEFGVYAFVGREEISNIFTFTVELVHTSPSLDCASFCGKPATLVLTDKSGSFRQVNGIVCEMASLHTGNRRTHYRCVIVPRLYFLQHGQNHRIFQNKTAVDIIAGILVEQGFASGDFNFSNSCVCPVREYCVQYGESDFHFINRLAEEEGIHYYFRHNASSHILCFSAMIAGPDIPGGTSVRFFPGSGQVASEAVIARLVYSDSVKSNASTRQDWNFEAPRLDLMAGQSEPDRSKAGQPGGLSLEKYCYPGTYATREDGERYAALQLARQLSRSRWITCESDAIRFVSGHLFSVREHYRGDINSGQWRVLSVLHSGEQPGVLEHEAPDRGHRYNATVTALPAAKRYIPPARHTKIPIWNKQTAMVTGPEGEEIYPDKYGRVKVQFFWDREGRWDENSSCWIRVSQGWAGPGYGTMAIPRIGHEVVVAFLEGDPDRPLIVGRVRHAENKPPYELPDNKTQTVFKSMTTPGSSGEERGFNEFKVEDKKGEEEIYIHAEKDVNLDVKNDRKDTIRHDRHQSVEGNTYLRTEQESHFKLEKQRRTVIRANDNLTVRKDSLFSVEGCLLAEAGSEIHLESDIRVVLAAGAALTLKVGDAWIKLDENGVLAHAPAIYENSGGSPGEGTPADPLLPEEGQTPVPPPPPVQPDCLASVANRGGVFCVEGD